MKGFSHFPPSCFARLLLIILEDVIHCDEINGYQVFAHNPNVKDISDAINKILATREINIKIKRNPTKQNNIEESSFEERCTTYFKENFETLAAKAPLVLPCKEPEKFKDIVKAMESWCRKTNTLSSIKGLILHSFSVIRHLEHFGFTREALKESLKIRAFSEEPVTIVYNPQENVLLLIRSTENKDLTTEIKLGLDDIKMFVLLFHDILKSSNLKLISLVVTDNTDNFKIKCLKCKNNVLSLEKFKDLPTFENWWEQRATYFEIEDLENINTDFIKKIVAKITGTAAATFIYGKYIPAMADKPNEKMANLAVLLTREQMEIVYSQYNHIILRGGFGCGKTIVAAVMLKKISENLKCNEKLYYICYDSRSESLDEMTQGAQKADLTNVTLLHNKEGRNLSEIIKCVLQRKKSTRKINFVVDEYDGEDLDDTEATNLNKIFNESLKETFILLIVQAIEKKRIINNILQNRNRFDLLKGMKLYQLNQVMRNSVEIHNLVKLTTDVFQKQQTVFVYQEDSKIEKKPKTLRFSRGIYVTLKSQVHGQKTVTTSPKTRFDITTKSSSKPRDPHEHLKETRELDEAKAAPGSVKRIYYEDTHKYSKENPSILKLGLDEALTVVGSIKRTGDEGVKTTNKFLFAAADKIGHKISSKKPSVFELGDKSDFQKILSLIVIFEKRQIQKSEQVVLHFDTGANEIPNNFLFTFEHHFRIQQKVTQKYEEFQSRKKSILVCSYPTFRGLEHPKVTVIIDCDIYYVGPYLVETLARCTSDLCVVILKNCQTLADVMIEWKTKKAIEQWEIKISEDASQVTDFEFDFTSNKNLNIINAKFRVEYYKKLQETFTKLLTEDKNFESKKKCEAMKIIQQR